MSRRIAAPLRMYMLWVIDRREHTEARQAPHGPQLQHRFVLPEALLRDVVCHGSCSFQSAKLYGGLPRHSRLPRLEKSGPGVALCSLDVFIACPGMLIDLPKNGGVN